VADGFGMLLEALSECLTDGVNRQLASACTLFLFICERRCVEFQRGFFLLLLYHLK